jgi:hypothetical protein
LRLLAGEATVAKMEIAEIQIANKGDRTPFKNWNPLRSMEY